MGHVGLGPASARGFYLSFFLRSSLALAPTWGERSSELAGGGLRSNARETRQSAANRSRSQDADLVGGKIASVGKPVDAAAEFARIIAPELPVPAWRAR